MTTNTDNNELYIHTISYFLSGDGFDIRLNNLCRWLVDTKCDVLLSVGEPDMKNYGRLVTFKFKQLDELVAFKLATIDTANIEGYLNYPQM